MPKTFRRGFLFPQTLSRVDVAMSLAFFALATFYPEVVFAEDSLSMGLVLCNIRQNIAPFMPLFNAIAFTCGFVLVIKGILLLRKHTDNPNDSQILKGIAHALAGGGLAALPKVVAVVQATLHMTTESAGNVTGCPATDVSTSSGSTPALDVLITNFITNVQKPLVGTVSALCFLMGVFLIIRGLLRSAKVGSDPRAAAPHVIVVNLLIGGIFTTVGRMLATMTTTLFGTASSSTFGGLIQWSKFATGTSFTEVDQTVTAILMFIQIIGAIGFVRGWLIIKNAVEGAGQATIPQGLTHILGGTMAFNIDIMLKMFDKTFGTQLVNA